MAVAIARASNPVSSPGVQRARYALHHQEIGFDDVCQNDGRHQSQRQPFLGAESAEERTPVSGSRDKPANRYD